MSVPADASWCVFFWKKEISLNTGLIMDIYCVLYLTSIYNEVVKAVFNWEQGNFKKSLPWDFLRLFLIYIQEGTRYFY